MLGDRKRYLGTFDSAEEAGRVFDKYTLAFRGIKVGYAAAKISFKAKTNFSYTREEVRALFEDEIADCDSNVRTAVNDQLIAFNAD